MAILSYGSELALPLPVSPVKNAAQDIAILYNAMQQMQKAVSGALGYDKIDLTVFPQDNASIYKLTRLHNLVAKVLTNANGTPVVGDFVAAKNDGTGELGIVKAINSTSTAPGLRAIGFVSYIENGVAIVRNQGILLFGADLVIGQRYYMSDTPGVITNGATNQYVGVAIAKRQLLVNIAD